MESKEQRNFMQLIYFVFNFNTNSFMQILFTLQGLITARFIFNIKMNVGGKLSNFLEYIIYHTYLIMQCIKLRPLDKAYATLL